MKKRNRHPRVTRFGSPGQTLVIGPDTPLWVVKADGPEAGEGYVLVATAQVGKRVWAREYRLFAGPKGAAGPEGGAPITLAAWRKWIAGDVLADNKTSRFSDVGIGMGKRT